MNKTELVKAVAEKAEVSPAVAAQAVAATFDTIQATLKKGEPVVLIGFGTFGVKKVAARKGRNPQTGEELKIKAHTAPFFKAGKGLKDAVVKTKVK